MLTAMLTGCAQSAPVVPDTSLRSFRPITLSCQDTAETRRQIVAHNSVYDSLRRGKRIVYRDDCPDVVAVK